MNTRKVKDVNSESYGYYDGMIPKGCITIIAGQGASGKSTLMCYLASSLSRNARTLIVSNEEPSGIIAGRINKYCDVTIASFSEQEDCRKITAQEVIDALKDFDLIFVDSLVTFNDGKDINKAGTAEAFLTPFVRAVVGTEKAIVFLHHTNKGGGDTLQDIVSGSERLVSGVRHCKIVINDKIHERRFLCVAKDNTGLPERNLEIISNRIELPDGGDTWVIKDLVPTAVDIEQIIYENSKAAKIKRWDKKMYTELKKDATVETPPSSIQRVLSSCKGKDINPSYITTELGSNEYNYFIQQVNRTHDKWVTKTKEGTRVTYHFTDLAKEWLDGSD